VKIRNKFSILFLLIFTTIFNSCAVKYAEKKFAFAEKKKPYDAIIVPGFPFFGASWHEVMKMRVLWSVYLYKHGFAKKIIFSGAAVYSPFTESEIMKMYAVQLGIPDSCIIIENKAQHSVENMYFSNLLALKLGYRKIGFASDPYQCKMIKGFRRRYRLKIDFIPAEFSVLDTIMKTEEPKIDFQKAFVPDFVPITEKLTKWQRFRGTMGKNIPKR
jgi:uncharacterized SAM-binding protein YcdF (DUF218 family)